MVCWFGELATDVPELGIDPEHLIDLHVMLDIGWNVTISLLPRPPGIRLERDGGDELYYFRPDGSAAQRLDLHPQASTMRDSTR